MEYFNNINNFDDIVKDLEKVLECKEIDEILIIIRDYELKILEYTTYNEQQKIILLEIESELKEIYSVYNSIKSFTEDEKNELDWSLIGDIYIKKSNLINNFLEQFGKINIDLEQTRLIILINTCLYEIQKRGIAMKMVNAAGKSDKLTIHDFS